MSADGSRAAPDGGLTPSAHDMNREWAVTSALADTNVPVAPTVAIDRDGEIIGAPCTVVEFVDGLVIRSTDDLNIWSDDEVTATLTPRQDSGRPARRRLRSGRTG